MTRPDDPEGGHPAAAPRDEGGDAMPDLSKPLRADFYYQTDAGRSKISKAALIYSGPNFRWTLDLKTFEVVHGLSRVVRLVPDKVVTALVINKENLPDPDDGTFLIKLVDDLVQVYVDRHHLAGPEAPENLDDFQVKVINLGPVEEPGEAGVGQSLADLLASFSDKLKELQRLLAERQLEEFRRQVEQFVPLCDYVRIACQVYLDLIYPVWIEVQRSGAFDDDKIQEKKVALLHKLERENEKLEKEYRQLLRENRAEP